MKTLLAPLIIALQLLTRLPITLQVDYSDKNRALSLLFYPWVGLLIGLLLIAAGGLLNWPGTELTLGLKAALLLVFWCFLTGFIHLDGLADSADAWVGGFGDRERTLKIMKDPVSGPIAVSLLVLVLLLKFELLKALIENHHWMAILLAPLFARLAMIPLFVTTPYARKDGLGLGLGKQLPLIVILITMAVALVIGFIALGFTLLKPLALCAVMYLLLRAAMIKRLGGTTGDTAGASIELLELSFMLALLF